MSAAVLLAPACADGGEGTTERPPPSRLTVTLAGGDAGAFRVDLSCDVADRGACAEILRALREGRDAASCEPIPDTGERILVEGLVEGREVRAVVPRRTDCEARLHDRVVAALLP